MLRLICVLGICLAALAWMWTAPALALQAQATAAPTAAVSTATPTDGTAAGASLQTAMIVSPRAGQALQGSVPIVVDTAVEGFEAVELAFAYTDNPTGTWFTLFQGNQPVSGEAIVQWDTSQISDGTYTLRLTVRLSDGSQQSHEVKGLRVRNYTAIESDTPTPVTPSATPLPQDTPVPSLTPTPTSTPRPPTPTPLPANPAVLEQNDVLLSVARGALAALGIFALVGLYGALRRFGK